MADLKDPRLMYLKAGLFLFIGVIACAGILLEAPSVRVALLLAAAIWAFCRLYYFLFYVIERYIDPEARFAGVGDAVKYLVRRRLASGLSQKYADRTS
jgi:hypothetical protein